MPAREEFLDDLSAAAVDLVAGWDALAARCGDTLAATSPCAEEARSFPPEQADPEVAARTIVADCVVYVAAASQQLRMLAKLDQTDLVLNGWGITRTIVEYCSRVAWLLAPDASPRNRLARWYMERISSAQRTRKAAKSMRDNPAAARAKKRRDTILADARTVFPGAEMYSEAEPAGWSIGGEPYVGLSKAADMFGRKYLNSKGLYDVLSGLTHPSLELLAQQTQTTPRSGARFKAFVARTEIVHWQFAVACLAVRWAAQHVAAYLEVEASDLEAWLDRHSVFHGGEFVRWAADEMR
ncbi:hypothetical protein ACFWXB_16205 [Tsukamurella tyrosinosolvens]|uniref:hypothetical protein n=1 Tax=Tsukamurella tyrosinosolvens TaxID=57704 RepID=UPI0036B15882